MGLWFIRPTFLFGLKDEPLCFFLSQMLESNCLSGGTPFVEEIELRTVIKLEFKRLGRPIKEQKVTN
jgi:hypothetical protein